MCGIAARVWKFNEEVVGENALGQLVASDNACQECIGVAIRIATEDVD